MFNEREWKIMYNNVFKVFPSPDNIIEQIVLKTDSGKEVFKTTSEFLSYICINGENILGEDLEYFLKDDSLKKEVESNVLKVVNSLKKREL